MTSNTNALALIMESVAARMRAEFQATKALAHNGAKGAARERIVHNLVAPHPPGHVQAVGSAEIISADGGRSGQCDVVIHDRAVPPLLDTENHRLIANECVYLVIEVKSSLAKKEKLFEACDQVAAVKSLPKVAADPGRFPIRFWPTVGMIFAFDGPSMETLGANLNEWATAHDPLLCPDTVWVLGRGFLSVEPSLDPVYLAHLGTIPRVMVVDASAQDIGLAFITRLSKHLTRAEMPPFNLDHYAAQVPIGTVMGSLPPPWDQATVNEAIKASWQMRSQSAGQA